MNRVWGLRTQDAVYLDVLVDCKWKIKPTVVLPVLRLGVEVKFVNRTATKSSRFSKSKGNHTSSKHYEIETQQIHWREKGSHSLY